MKDAVRTYWDAQACGTEWTANPKYSREYFDEIERVRYQFEPGIPAFAHFDEARGLDVLEVGVGAGTDFIQWVRAGARARGVDLTAEAVEHVRRRLTIYGLTAGVQQGDCENLPFEDGAFDLVYSWGVIHHTPDTERALSELVRVCRPGGVVRLMIYNRRSLLAFYLWVRWALLYGQPWRSLTWVIARHMESPGTKAYTEREVREMLAWVPVHDVCVAGMLTKDDRLESIRSTLGRALAAWIARTAGESRGWFLTVEFRKRD
jgi:SAM-dependent methyltransferase